jgi:hypothetical protein
MNGKRYLILLGAPKCATTSLAAWLERFPDAAKSKHKETLFFTGYGAMEWSGPGAHFNRNAPGTEEEFAALFAHRPDADLRIEASTDNLSSDLALEAIQRFAARSDVRSVKLLAVTRDPVQRIVSEYEHTLRLGWQTGDLMGSLRSEEKRRAARWHPMFYHVHRTRYASQIDRFRAAFGSELKVVDYHQLSSPEVLAGIASFAGLDPSNLPEDLGHRNARKVYERPALERRLTKSPLRKRLRRFVPPAVRARVRSLVQGAPLERYTPTDAEIAAILDALRSEIDACVADPDIQTQHWACLGAPRAVEATRA